MDDLERTLLFHCAIDSSTMKAGLRHSALLIDLLKICIRFKIIFRNSRRNILLCNMCAQPIEGFQSMISSPLS